LLQLCKPISLFPSTVSDRSASGPMLARRREREPVVKSTVTSLR